MPPLVITHLEIAAAPQFVSCIFRNASDHRSSVLKVSTPLQIAPARRIGGRRSEVAPGIPVSMNVQFRSPAPGLAKEYYVDDRNLTVGNVRSDLARLVIA
jgi:hypothetical protein